MEFSRKKNSVSNGTGMDESPDDFMLNNDTKHQFQVSNLETALRIRIKNSLPLQNCLWMNKTNEKKAGNSATHITDTFIFIIIY